jgi:hypothetical protein
MRVHDDQRMAMRMKVEKGKCRANQRFNPFDKPRLGSLVYQS